MSAATHGHTGVSALNVRDYPLAITSLTRAIESAPSPKWLIARSRALVATEKFDDALADAEHAYRLALERGSRDLVLDAQYRRAVALFRLGKFADADACLAWVMAVCGGARLADAEKAVGGTDAEGRYTVTKADVEGMLREKRAEQEVGKSAEEKLAGATQQGESGVWKMAGSLRLSVLQAMQAAAEDHPGRKLSVPVVPPKEGAPAVIAKQGGGVSAPAKPVVKQVRVDAYETDEYQTVSVFTKNVDKEKFGFQFVEPNKLVLEPLPEAPTGSAILELGGTPKTDAITATVRPMKVELRIGKTSPTKWNTPKCHYPTSTTTDTIPSYPIKPATTHPTTQPPHTSTSPSAKTPAYPTSSKSGPKNWDTIADDEDEDESKTDPDAFFKQLYAGATEEQKRAMMKSFTESNGTTLSTDWGDVGGRKVETKPPEGVEAKQWE